MYGDELEHRDLEIGPFGLILVLRSLTKRAFGGTMHLSAEAAAAEPTVAYFFRGRIVCCTTDRPERALTGFILRRGQVDRIRVQDTLRRQRATDRPLEELLVESGTISRDELVAAKNALSAALLTRAMEAPGLRCRLAPSRPHIPYGTELDANPWDAFFRAAVGGLHFDFQRGRVLSLPRGPLCATSALPPVVDRFERHFGALGQRVIEFVREGRSAAEVARLLGDVAAAVPPLFALTFSELAVVDTTKPEAHTPSPAPLPETATDKVREILDERDRMGDRTAYETLDITPHSALSEIREAYRRVRGRYDLLLNDAEVMENIDAATALSELCTSVDEAYQLLSCADRRPLYDAQLGLSNAEEPRYASLFEAEEAYVDGLVAMRHANWQAAMQALRTAIRKNPDDAAYFATLALAMARASKRATPDRREKLVLTGRKLLERAMHINPHLAVVNLCEARFERDIGDNERAIACYRKALEIQPYLEEATRELQQLLGS